jgi:hypothetical protein
MTEVPDHRSMSEAQWLSWLLRVLPDDLRVEMVTEQRTVRVRTLEIDIVLDESGWHGRARTET